MSTHRASLLALLALLVVLGTAALALAQAIVLVQVRTADGRPGEALVTLTPEGGGGSPRSCRTAGGTCRMSGVPAGRYVVTAEPASGGQAPVPRVVPVPPTSEVTVSVTLP